MFDPKRTFSGDLISEGSGDGFLTALAANALAIFS